jgi:DNA replication protein DnaC
VQPDGWLVLTGEYGCGKTHLAAAIANERTSTGQPALFVVVPDLLDHLRATFSPTSNVRFDKRFEEVRTTPLLVLDDLGTESASPWAQEKLFQVLNHRYNARLPTVVTMAQPIDEVDPRLRTRMLDMGLCTVFAIIAPSYRGTPQRRATRRGKPRSR